jgi:hypothetical protein
MFPDRRFIMSGGSQKTPTPPPNPYADMMAAIAQKQWQNAKKMYGFSVEGGRVPGFMIDPIVSRGNESINNASARAFQRIGEMAPGGMREKSLRDLAMMEASQQIGLRTGAEQSIRQEARSGLTGGAQTALQGLGMASNSWDQRMQAAMNQQSNRGSDMMSVFGQLAGAAGMVLGAHVGGPPGAMVGKTIGSTVAGEWGGPGGFKF